MTRILKCRYYNNNDVRSIILGTQVLKVGKFSKQIYRGNIKTKIQCQQSNLLDARTTLWSCFFHRYYYIFISRIIYGFRSSDVDNDDDNNNNSIYFYCKVSNVCRTHPLAEGIDAAARGTHTSSHDGRPRRPFGWPDCAAAHR